MNRIDRLEKAASMMKSPRCCMLWLNEDGAAVSWDVWYAPADHEPEMIDGEKPVRTRDQVLELLTGEDRPTLVWCFWEKDDGMEIFVDDWNTTLQRYGCPNGGYKKPEDTLLGALQASNVAMEAIEDGHETAKRSRRTKGSREEPETVGGLETAKAGRRRDNTKPRGTVNE